MKIGCKMLSMDFYDANHITPVELLLRRTLVRPVTLVSTFKVHYHFQLY
jgi:hypothetical protein